MKILHLASAVALFVSAAVQAQKMAVWTEPTSGVIFQIAIPEAEAAPFDMLLSITAPNGTGWAGFASGGCMLRSPLLVVWPNEKGVTLSTRWATAYHPPAIYNGTKVSVLSTSATNETHWTANLLCSGCSAWTGGSVDPLGNGTFGFGVSDRPVANPSNTSSAIRFHNVAVGHFELEMHNARLSKADFGALVTSFGGAATA